MSEQQIKTDEGYWDCECMTSYIHSKKYTDCSTCGANKEEAPDSRVVEISIAKELGQIHEWTSRTI